MQLKLHIVTIEDLVPEEHFLRRLEAALDLSFIYRETEKLYSRRYGRPPIDPVVLVKYLLVGYLYGIPSERQIEQRIQTDVALRWYLGLDLLDRVPDHSTISQLRRRKPSFRKVLRRLFEEVVGQCVRKGLVSGRLAATDSTHVKANASPASEHMVEAAEKPGAYWERLDAYEEEALEELNRRIQAGKTGRKRRQKGRSRQVRSPLRYDRKWASCTDPESGHLNRPGKPKGPHHLSHQTVDCDHGIILDVAVTSGEVNDAAPYLRQLEHIHQDIIPIQAAVADAAYDLPLFHRVLRDLGGVPGSPFIYDEEKDLYTCPGGKTLRLRNLNRSVGGLHWVYFADRSDCAACPLRWQCVGKGRAKRLERSYFWREIREDLRELDSPTYQRALRKRQIWSEGTFAAQKWGHRLGQLLRRGAEATEDHCLLSATALNLKRMIKWAR